MTTLGRGCYPLPEAARLARLPYATVYRWFRGPRPLLASEYPSVDGDFAISFLDLIEVVVVGQLRRADPPVSMREIREFREAMIKGGRNHPFARPYLRGCWPAPIWSQLRHDPSTGLADLWRIAPGVVVDPQRRFGNPFVEAAGISTHVLADSYVAEGADFDHVARVWGIEPGHVRAAVEFEREFGTSVTTDTKDGETA